MLEAHARECFEHVFVEIVGFTPDIYLAFCGGYQIGDKAGEKTFNFAFFLILSRI